MPLTTLRQFLDSKQTKHIVITHSLAYTTQGVAATAHIPGRELAKTVIGKIDGTLAMVVVPASRKVDLAMLKAATGAKIVDLASERAFRDRFPDCETGAMPPFGHLYGMRVFADESLVEDKEIAFNAGTHRQLVRMAWEDAGANGEIVHCFAQMNHVARTLLSARAPIQTPISNAQPCPGQAAAG